MNFCKLYIGDYLRDTGTLTLAQHGAYMLMLMQFYATEKALPVGRDLYRLLRAETKAEREAIDFIASRFWAAGDDGLTNSRGLDEIARADHQRTVNREIGKRGGRPRRTETETESVSESQANRNPPQTPDTRHQTKTVAREKRARDDFEGLEGFTPTPAGRVCRLMRSAGLADVNPGHPSLLALIEQGATDEEFSGIAAEAAEKRKGFAWLLKVLEARRAEAASLVLAPKPKADPEAWKSSRKAVITRGCELGIGPFDEVGAHVGTGPTWTAYLASVVEADRGVSA